ncbi:MAG: PA2779 family protein [Gemmatimonadota bacterium]
MKRLFPAVALIALLSVPAQGLAQEHAVSPEALDAMAVEHAASVEADRAELRAFLDRPEVRRVAAEAGVDVQTAVTAVASLSAEEVADLSGRVAQAEAALDGGDRIVISTTAIIIGLLILIVILVA